MWSVNSQPLTLTLRRSSHVIKFVAEKSEIVLWRLISGSCSSRTWPFKSPCVRTRTWDSHTAPGDSDFKFKSKSWLVKMMHIWLCLLEAFFCILTRVMAFADNVVTSVQFWQQVWQISRHGLCSTLPLHCHVSGILISNISICIKEP